MYKVQRAVPIINFVIKGGILMHTKSLNILNCHNCSGTVRLFCDKINWEAPVNSNDKSDNNITLKELTQRGLSSKYTFFHESDATVILDVYEEKMQLENDRLTIAEEERDEFHGVNVERGVRGVFDIEDLIDLLKRDKAEDIFVAALPPEARYVDHIVVVNGISRKHMIALASIVRRVYKKKRLQSDILPRIEGETSADWVALDLGNIALHIFSRKARRIYDLDSLWCLGPEFDPLINAPEDPLVALLKKHAISLNEMNIKGELL